MAFFKVENGGGQRSRGFAKIAQHGKGQVLVEYFDVPGQVEPPSYWAPLSQVRAVSLPAQTRVFVLSDDQTWRVGRVLNGDGDRILVQLPNSAPALVHTDQVFVRWTVPIEDPISFLSQKINETPLFADARSDFLAAVTAQRVATQGIGALLSSQIELNAYQFEVVRRILHDPVQRYLLADEVGLGKTIEAGILIRQFFLDEPETARVLIIVPPALVGQWRQELTQRFLLGDLLDDFLHVVGADDLSAIRDEIKLAGMLVVDEAHHLSNLDDGGSNALYQTLLRHAHLIPRLLLLSATPALVDEAGFLRMVHLLDPVIFPLDDIEGFQRRIAARQEVAETMAALVPEDWLNFDEYLDRLLEAFSDDVLLTNYVRKLQLVLERYRGEEGDAEFLGALACVRTHLSETCRLHRRIMRNRRSAVPWATPKRVGLEVWRYDSDATEYWSHTLEALRLAVANSDAAQDSKFLRALFEAALNPGVRALRGALMQLGLTEYPELEDALAEFELASASLAADGARLTRLVDGLDELLRGRGKIIVFCGDEEVADSVYERLEEEFGRHAVRHSLEFDEESGAKWHRFHDDDNCRILVCDRQAEEGLNLHGRRKMVVNYDTPLSPNTFEQRLGRVDRFGAGDDIQSYALAGSEHLLAQAWIACLDTGFGVFSQSIASSQYLVDVMLRDLPYGWLNGGLAHIDQLKSELSGDKGLVRQEMRRIDQQDRLDSLEGEGDKLAFEALEDADEDWRCFGEAIDGFAFQALQFAKRPIPLEKPVQEDQLFRVSYEYNKSRETLMTVLDFVECFGRELDEHAPGSSSKTPMLFPYTYRRRTALAAARQHARVLRYGAGFVEALTRFVDLDDRGRGFAMWRHRPTVAPRNERGVDLYFRFDFLIEASIEKATAVIDDAMHGAIGSRAIRRVADGIMPPRFVRVWLDDQMRWVDAPPPELLETYRNRTAGEASGRDYNLKPERWATLEARELVSSNWDELCHKARDVAQSALLEQVTFAEHVAASLQRMEQMRALKHGQSEARIARLSGVAREAEQAEAVRQDAVDRALANGIAQPKVRLDSAGAIFLSNFHPFVDQ
ncbi:protein DpdE [Telluria sp. Tellsp104]